MSTTQKSADVAGASKPKQDFDDDVIFVDTEKSSQSKTGSAFIETNKESNAIFRGSTTPPVKSNLSSPDASPVQQVAPKRSDWDMFAEQDIDSNFDVSII